MFIVCKREDIITTNLQINPERGGNPNKESIRTDKIKPKVVELDKIPPSSIILFFFKNDRVNNKEDAVRQ